VTPVNFPELFGGVACLDFANTLDGRATAQPEEHLRSYADLVSWAGYAGLVDPATAARLAGCPPATAEAALQTALELREAIFRAFAAIGRGDPVPTEALTVVQRRYADTMAAAQLVPADAGFDWYYGQEGPDGAWQPVAVSAVQLLTAGPLERVKVCAAEAGCIGLFLDTSKNRSRRWCTTDGCGVDAKVKRQAIRRRAARSIG
jgi:predicted RNA-binding Zn ribbon-like protein